MAAALVSLFPVKTRPAVPVPTRTPFTGPVLWIHAPDQPESPLSADVECLKWQAYLALRGLTNLRIRTNIHPAGAIDGRLPNLLVAQDTLIAAQHIPTWADEQTAPETDPLEGYKDEEARDESRAWVTLLEKTVHAGLLLSLPPPSYLSSLLSLTPSKPDALQTLLVPPPPPLTGFSSLFPPSGTRISHSTVHSQYIDAISALSDRLGTDKWFLGST
jgi:metaxin